MKIGVYIFSIVLTLLIVLNSTKVTLSYAYYEFDPISFVEALCENKDKPELACNGSCHLTKMAKSHDKEQNTPENIIDFKELNLYQNSFTELVLPNKIFEKKYNPKFYLNLYSFSNTNDCFHPPKV